MVNCSGTKSNQLDFRQVIYDCQTIEESKITRKEAEVINFSQFDCCLAICVGHMGFKNSQGNWCDFRQPGRLVDTDYFSLLKCLQDNPGIKLKRNELVKLTNLDYFNFPGELPTMIYRLRYSFCESKNNAIYILTHNVGILTIEWPKERSWIRITPILP